MSTFATWKQFTDIVERNFSFLVKEYGFELPLNSEPYIRYNSIFIQVQIFHDLNERWDLEVSIDSLQGSPCGEFSIDTIEFEQIHRQDWGSVSPRFPSNQLEYLESLMYEESDRLKKYCSEVLRGNFEDIYRLNILKQEFKKRLTSDYQHLNRHKGYTAMVIDLMNQIIKEKRWQYD
jgi:hypothetical protein